MSDFQAIQAHISFYFILKILFIFREGKGGRETAMSGCLSHTPNWGPGPTTQPCDLTGNRTGAPLVRSLCSTH